MLECRLAGGDDRVDLLCCVSDVGDARDGLARSLHAGALGLCAPAARGQLLDWARPPDASLAASPQLWLEWDRLDREGNTPLIWWGAEPAFFDRSAPPHPTLALACLGRQIGPGAAAFAAPLAEIVGALPEGGRLLGVGTLRPRDREAVRAFCEVPARGLGGWLEAIAWPGDVAVACGHARAALAPAEPAFVQLELLPEPGPYLGIEARQTVAGFPSRPWRRSWMRSLVKAGLCDPGKAKAVLSWPGSSPWRGGTLHRSFHCKVALRGDAPPEAKAYLGLAFTTP